jgi:hypothetical protein
MGLAARAWPGHTPGKDPANRFPDKQPALGKVLRSYTRELGVPSLGNCHPETLAKSKMIEMKRADSSGCEA